jgi:streptogramin lyase
MKSTAHPIPEAFERKLGKIDDIKAVMYDSTQSWISTTTTLYNPNDGLVYLGLTQMDGDILYAFDPATGKSECLNYMSVRGEHEVKVHRSLQIGPDGRVYSGSAGLINLRIRDTSPGGQVWAYDPKTKQYEMFGIPSPHDYIQHTTYDFERQIVYGCTYPVPFFFAFDLKTRTSKLVSYNGAYPHKSAIDDSGKVWTGYSMSADIAQGENLLMSYDPDTNEITWHEHGLPVTCAYGDNKQIDDIINLGDGYIYAASVNGGFSRIDPKTAEVEWLGKPARGMRLCGIDEGPDGRIYLATGAFYGMTKQDSPTHIFAYDRDTRQFEDLGVIDDPDFGDSCAVVHSLSIGDDGTMWVGETDNGTRSGCLWECHKD